MINLAKAVLYWTAHLLLFVAAILVTGTIVGSILFLVLGNCFGDYGWLFLLKQGAWAGFRYAGVWAGGVAIVLCFIKGAKRRASL